MAPPSLVHVLRPAFPNAMVDNGGPATHVHHPTNSGYINRYLSKPAEPEVQLVLAGKMAFTWKVTAGVTNKHEA